MPQRMFGTCQVEGCQRPHKARGYCSAHYQHFKRGIPIKAEIRERDMSPPDMCTEPGCDLPARAKGLCNMHYARLLRHGYTRFRERTREPKRCTFPGCSDVHYAKGLCHIHYSRRRGWSRKFGVSVEQYEAMLAEQDSKCAICRSEKTREDWRSGKQHALAVDHDHVTKKVRGLLCDNCNRAIGMLGDSIETVRFALAYLERHKPPE